MAAIEARHAGQLAALEAKVATLEEKLAAEEKDREEAVGRLRKEQEAERERVKRVIADLKKKHDRWNISMCIDPGGWSTTLPFVQIPPTHLYEASSQKASVKLSGHASKRHLKAGVQRSGAVLRPTCNRPI